MKFESILKRYFDRVYTEADFIEGTYKALSRLGFSADNTIACVGICRDEISQSFFKEANRCWGNAFNLSSLTGMLFAGRTELMIAMSHSPNEDRRERYVFYSLPHIAINEEGRIGICKRSGRTGESIACGALNVFQKEISSKAQRLKVENSTFNLDIDDVELSLMRLRLIKEIPSDHVPDLLELTKITQKVIQRDLENALNALVDTNKSDYAVLTGIQIHGTDGNYTWPASCYAVVNGEKIELKVE